MYLSRIKISNFRNFSELDVTLNGNVVVVGENRIGKSNLLYALRLIFDPTLPDSARQLTISDFWDGLGQPDEDDSIVVSVEIKDFEDNMKVLSLLTDFRLDDDAETVRLTYTFRPKADLEGDPAKDSDYEFVCFGGESEAKWFGHDLRRRITLDLMPALRDAEGDLANWRWSPLRPLIEEAFSKIELAELEEIKGSVEAATAKIADFEEIKALEESIATSFEEMSGPKQNVDPKLGFTPLDLSRLSRGIRLLIDGGLRGISEASLGSANLIFLTLKALHLNHMIEENQRDHTILTIEEPEAHLHPHLQRSVYRHLFETVGKDKPLSAFLTTHSPHVASVAPLRSIILLKDTEDDGTVGRSTASLELEDDEVEDLTRYLDVTRAEMLFARGVILVEGDSERFLVPEFAQTLDKPLDRLGITVCSVSGTNFRPYVKFLTGLDIPFSVITDWDPIETKSPLGWRRTLRLAETIQTVRDESKAAKLTEELNAIKDGNEFCKRCEAFGIFSGYHTFEIDLFNGNLESEIIAALKEGPFGKTRMALLDEWKADPESLDHDKFISMIETMGKGRFAQRLAAHAEGVEPPDYITSAIKFVADRV